MKLVAVLALCTAFVVGDLLTLTQFTDEVLQIAAFHNYDAIFVDLETFLDKFPRNPTIPRYILQSSCIPVSIKRILYFIELPRDSFKVFDSLSRYSQGIILLFYRNSSITSEAISRNTDLLRQQKISKAIHVIYDPATLCVYLIPYDFIRTTIQSLTPALAILDLFNPNSLTNLHGYRYLVHFKHLFPYIYWEINNGIPKPLGLDAQILQIITTHQNATVQFQRQPKAREPCPPANPSIDLNVRRSACSLKTTDRLFLPQWDEACIVVPKRHQRLILLQFTKPFQLEVWIFAVVYVLARFFLRFDRWRLLLLLVGLTEFWLTESYGAKVIEYMSTLRYAPSPKTIAELIARGERFIVGPPESHYLEAYTGIDVQVTASSKEKYIGRRALVYFCRTVEAFINSDLNYNPQTNDRVNIVLKEVLGSYPSSYGCTSSHPLRAGFERNLRYVFENGVWRKIHDQFRRHEAQFEPLVSPGEYLIEFGDLVPIWIGCGIGWAVAVGVFVAEIAWKLKTKF